MVVTRNQERQAKKIKFDDDGTADIPEPVNDEQNPEIISDDEQDDDSDEAPEEESTTTAKQAIIAKQRAEKAAEAELRKQEREKRRQQDIYNKQQQEEKKLKQRTELPDILPDDILEAANNQEPEPEPIPVSKHKKLQDFDVEIKQQIKREKLKQLKALNKASIKKGPVHVKVLQSTKGVPRAEKVVNARDKWLKRKALGRR